MYPEFGTPKHRSGQPHDLSTVTAQELRAAFANEAAQQRYRELRWVGTFDTYLDMVAAQPSITASAHQRVYAMIMSYGTEKYSRGGREYTRFKFFDDPMGGGRNAVFGLDRPLMSLVQSFESAAKGFGAEKRLLLMVGPVGSSKSTIAGLMKRGLEEFSRTPEGAVHALGFTREPIQGGPREEIDKRIDALSEEDVTWSPMNVEPLAIFPADKRDQLLAILNKDKGEHEPKVQIHGGLDPLMRFHLEQLLSRYDGDFNKVLDHVVVRRVLFSEDERVGIATFQPKDPKSQDSTELTGDVNFRKLAELGIDSDPRAFSFDGEFCKANRGVIEFIEVLKLEREFLYDLLGVTAERAIKPKKFPQTRIDTVAFGHTNEPEFKAMNRDESQQALRDRILVHSIPYTLRLKDEMRVYEKDYTSEKVRRHIAPHTVEVAAMFAVCSRLEEPKRSNMTLLQKMRLYNGDGVAGFTEQTVRELEAEAEREGHSGISPRFIQNVFGDCLTKNGEESRRFLSPFMLLDALRKRISENLQATTQDEKTRLLSILDLVEQEYKEMVKKDVQLAIAGDVKALETMGQKYVEHISAYQRKQKVENKLTTKWEEPDAKFMRSIEEKIGITEAAKDDFRREILQTIGGMAASGRKFNPLDNDRLKTALEKKLFEDTKDTLPIKQFVNPVLDDEQRQKLDTLKDRLKKVGYNDDSAEEVLRFVASILAR